MTDFKWRIWAKTVAIIDLIFIGLQLMLVLLAACAVLFNNSDTQKSKGWVLWLSLIILLIATGIGLWAAFKLFKATTMGQQPDVAYQFSRYWQIVSIVFIILIIMQGSTASSFISMTVGILIRFIFMFVVYRFMQEVQEIINTPPQQTTRKV